MLKSILETTANVLRLAQNVPENREELKEVRKEFRDLVLAVERLSVRMEGADERDERERQMIVLRMENLLLRRADVLGLPGPEAEVEVQAGP